MTDALPTISDPALKDQLDRRREIVDQLKRLLIDNLTLQLSPDEIDPDAALFGSGLDLDSIDAVEIVTAVETSFNVRLRDFLKRSSLRTLNTLADAVLEARKKHASIAS
jgi:acyl carrier protein